MKKFNYGKIFLLGFGFFGVSVIWTLYNAFVPLFLANKFNLSPALIGFFMVIRRGAVVGEADPKTASANELAEMMVGREVKLVAEKDIRKPGKVVLSVKDLVIADHLNQVMVDHVSFDVHAVLSIKYKINQIISGTVINIFSTGMTSFISQKFLQVHQELNNPAMFNRFPIPGLANIPLVGPIFFNTTFFVYAMMTFFLPYVVTFLFYIVIFLSASLLLNSITGEKQNRTIEVLLTSVTPDEMLTGKILALGVAGLMQTIIWFGSGLLLLKISNQTLALSDAFVLPASILAWGILFFLFGYAVYASIMIHTRLYGGIFVLAMILQTILWPLIH